MTAEILVDLFADLTPASAVSGAIGVWASCSSLLYLAHDAERSDFDPRPLLARAVESGRVDPVLCAVANAKHDTRAAPPVTGPGSPLRLRCSRSPSASTRSRPLRRRAPTMPESKNSTFTNEALYLDAHGGIWRATSDATELTHVKRWDEMATLDPTVSPWVEPAEKVAAEFGPVQFLSDALAPAQEAVFLFAIVGKDAYDADVVHRALGLLDEFGAEVAR